VSQAVFREGVPLYPNGIRSDVLAKKGHKFRVSIAPLCIVELRLDSIPEPGTPARVLEAAMQGVYVDKNAALTVEYIKFHVSTTKQRDDHKARLSALVKRLEK
jgi:hypothetical protein